MLGSVSLRLVTCCLLASCASASGQYVLFARPPGSSFNQEDPSTLNAAWLAAPNVGIGTNTSAGGSLRIGSEIIFSLLQSDESTLLASLRAALNASEATGVPVSVVLDGENWWGARPDLWNWWDPSRAGYNATNAHNVEWTAPGNASSAVKIGWRNWGSQISCKLPYFLRRIALPLCKSHNPVVHLL